MNLRPFDFHEIAALDGNAKSFRDWVSKSSSYFSDYWFSATGYAITLKAGQVKTSTYDSMIRNIPRTDMSSMITTNQGTRVIWFAPLTEFRALLSELLGVPQPEEPDDKDLSDIEADLAEMLLEQLTIAFGRGWIGQGEVSLEHGKLERDPRKFRLIRSKDLVSQIEVKFEAKSCTASMFWLIPKRSLSELMDLIGEERVEPSPQTPPKEIVGRIPVELVTQLGEKDLSMEELVNLKPGQLIRLDQRIDEPMTGYIDGLPTHRCWAGRLGSRQAIQIADTLDQKEGASYP